ncbi:MAG: mscL [Candidatus Taylorbacteria bacterium]|nr:mscL [Candidatus Taylorbacteria bacterium]
MNTIKNIANEFKSFAMRGNVIDLAVGVIVGGAFGKITTSLVTDIFNPILGLIVGKIDFANLFFALDFKNYPTLEAAKAAGVTTINYGLFINAVIDFVLVSFAVFIMIREINKLKRHEDQKGTTADPDTKKCPFCVSTISVCATKCPQCTSELPPDPKEEKQSKENKDK